MAYNGERRLRAVIYNRCSTEEDAQKDALAKQVKEARECVAQQGWQLVDAYVEAKSGTTMKGRTEYYRLYQDLERDTFDIIVIKSQDRLMRNTGDWYLFLERMQKNKKRLYMYLEHKFYTPDDALITGIKAILAEEYSRELSRKINNAHYHRQKEGKSFVFTNRMYGLKKLPDKRIVIDEREAEMVRRIFELSANGYGAHCCAELLFESGYKNRSGGMLSPSTIRNIVRNPIYKGTVIQNRRHYDFEGKQIFKNPEEEWVIHENAVPAIVEEALFERANREMDQRRQPKSSGSNCRGQRSGRPALSGKLFCGCCGSPFYRTVRQTKAGQIAEWKCSSYLRHGRRDPQRRRNGVRKAPKKEAAGCDNVHLKEEAVYRALEAFFEEKEENAASGRASLIEDAMGCWQRAQEGVEAGEREAKSRELARLARQKAVLLDKLLEQVILDSDFLKKNEELTKKAEWIERQMSEQQDAKEQEAERKRKSRQIRAQLEEGLAARACCLAEIGELDKILVFPQGLELFPRTGAAVWIPHGCGPGCRAQSGAENK